MGISLSLFNCINVSCSFLIVSFAVCFHGMSFMLHGWYFANTFPNRCEQTGCSWSYKYYLCQGCLWIWISVIVHPWSVYRWNNFHLEITLINLWRKITQWEIYIHFYVSWDTIISTAFCFFIWKCATPISKCVQYFFIILLLWNYLKKLYTMSMSCIVNITCIHLCLLQ